MISEWFKTGRLPPWVMWGMSLLAAGSLGVGVYNAIGSSCDFQWSPSKLLWRGVNPYEYFLLPQHPDIILFQAPNYGHLLYLLLWPYAQLDWMSAKVAWLLTNFVFLGAGLWLMQRTLTDPWARRQFVVMSLLMCIGFTARNVLANGQQTFIVFIGAMVFLIYRERPVLAGLALALVLTKYSFGLQIVFLAFVLGYYRAVLVAAGITFAGILAFGTLSGTGGLELLLGPIPVTRVATVIGYSDLLSLGRRLSGGDPFASRPLVALSVFVNLAYFGWIQYKWRGERNHSLKTVALLLGGTVYLSFGTLYHQKQDYQMAVVGLYAYLLTGAWRPQVFAGLLVAHFLVYWLLPRHEALFAPGLPGTFLVMILIASFLALAVMSIRVAATLLRNRSTTEPHLA